MPRAPCLSSGDDDGVSGVDAVDNVWQLQVPTKTNTERCRAGNLEVMPVPSRQDGALPWNPLGAPSTVACAL